ncbi:MAG: cardiolipin synthase [Prevotellaceae bacterium]|jgi:cardiolipin synthase|nr:cardiolipin synthase [Prevotellaceae bacterium]
MTLWQTIQTYWYELLTVCNFIAAVVIIFFMVGKKLDPIKTISWCVVLIAVPFAGLIFYLFLGRNYRKEKIFNRKEIHDLVVIDQLSKRQVALFRKAYDDTTDSVARYKRIITLLLNNSKAIYTDKNKVDVYTTGKATFAAMKAAIAQATDSIHLESYIIEDDTIGNEFKKLLIHKAREGVEVRVIYDDVGSWSLPKQYIQALKDGGVEIYPFAEVRILWLSTKVNYRNHRKILVVDGRVGFLGGINIADRYLTGGKFGTWRDTHMRIEGEAVHSLQTIFLLDWYFVSKKQLGQRLRYYPAHKVEDICPMQIASSGPDSDWASVMQTYFSAIAQAKDHIYIATPYFTPNESILSAVKVASLSGVDVRLIIPAHSDSKMVYFSTLSYLTELLEAGVKIYLFQKGFIHSKLMTIDGNFAAVGSANMDIRSFEHNFEIISLIYDEQITQKLETQFVEDICFSRLVRLRWWNKRSWLSKSKEALARLCSPLL